MAHGGKREGAGRKSKAEEQKLIEKLSPIEPIALDALKKGIENNQSWAVKMYFDYYYGKPVDRIEFNDVTELPPTEEEIIEELDRIARASTGITTKTAT